jgi:hypothetical protein
MKKFVIRICKLPSSAESLQSNITIPTYRIKHECNTRLCCLCLGKSNARLAKNIGKVLQVQRNRISQTEIYIYIDFIRECYSYFVLKRDDEQYKDVCISLSLSLLLRALSLEYFHTKRQKYSLSAACLMLSLNSFIDEHRVRYSGMICFHPLLHEMTPRYLAVSNFFLLGLTLPFDSRRLKESF